MHLMNIYQDAWQKMGFRLMDWEQWANVGQDHVRVEDARGSCAHTSFGVVSTGTIVFWKVR